MKNKNNNKSLKTKIIVIIVICLITLFFTGTVRLKKVSGNSMYPAIKNGDICIVINSKEIKIGDIICYRNDIGGNFVIHRVTDIQIIKNSKADSKSSNTVFKTKGDNNEEEDNLDVTINSTNKIMGKVICVIPTHIAKEFIDKYILK